MERSVCISSLIRSPILARTSAVISAMCPHTKCLLYFYFRCSCFSTSQCYKRAAMPCQFSKCPRESWRTWTPTSKTSHFWSGPKQVTNSQLAHQKEICWYTRRRQKRKSQSWANIPGFVLINLQASMNITFAQKLPATPCSAVVGYILWKKLTHQ